jgi:flagellar biosynthesis protein FliR
LGKLGNIILSAGSTPPLGVTVPEVNQFENSTAATVHVGLTLLGTTVWALAAPLKHSSANVVSAMCERALFDAVRKSG